MSTEPDPQDRFAAAWRRQRAYVVDLAFRLLGDIGAAEDAAQEAFTRLARTRPGEVGDERAWLTVVTSRICLDELRSARVRRERSDDPERLESAAPVATPLPVDPVDRITLDEEVARRARIKMTEARRPDGPVAAAEHRAVTERFIAACAGGDLAELLVVLDPEVWGLATFRPDSPIVAPISRGPEVVAANMIAFFGPGTTLVTHSAFGRPALLAYRDRELFSVLVLTVADDRIVSIEATVDR